MSEYTIDQVSWHTRSGSEPKEKTLRRFRAIAAFLDANDLTTKPLLGKGVDVGEEFRIHTTALTRDGLELMRKSYDRWVRGIDRGRPPEDVSVLERTLAKIRNPEA